MEYRPNGDLTNGVSHPHTPPGGAIPNGTDELSLEDLERELPVVYEGMVPLGELASRVAQAVYAELTELAET